MSSAWIRTRWGFVVAAVAVVLVVGLGVWLVVSRDSSPDRPRASSQGIPATTPSSAAPVGPSANLSPTLTPSASAFADSCVATTIAGLSRDERVGQLLMVGTPVNGPRELSNAVGHYHLGGVFLAGRSNRPAAALRGDVAALQRAARVPLLIALDQEGGSVQTLKGPDFPIVASALSLSGGSKAALRTEAGATARRLAGIGVTTNLAPVADTVPTGVGTKNPPIGALHRQYGSDPDQVADDIRTVVTASQSAGVLTTLKHFPGLGRVRANTDTSTKAVDTTATETDPYLKPFAAGIDAGSAAVMVSSASYPRLDPHAIAAFSQPIVTGLLRNRLGYTGLIMSDDLGAADAVEAVRAGDRAVRFVRAGGDLVLTIRPQDAVPMIQSLLSAIHAHAAFDARVTDAVRHVLKAKYRAGILKCAPAP